MPKQVEVGPSRDGRTGRYTRRAPRKYLRADTPVDWLAFEQIEAEQLRKMDERQHREGPEVAVVEPVTWQGREADRQRRRIEGYGLYTQGAGRARA
jgi:hypothetical protein